MAKKFIKKEITPDIITKFIEGQDPQERIVNFTYNYNDDFITVIYRNEEDKKCTSKESFFPFVWAKKSACLRLCKGNKTETSNLLKRYGIWVKELDTTNKDGVVVPEMTEGYMYLFYATRPMSYSKFLEFFRVAGVPVYSKSKEDKNKKSSFTDQPTAKKNSKEFLTVTPVEQFMISTGKRMFKGYDDYNQLLRMIFDLETEGLNPKKDRIKLNGIRLNRPVTFKGKTYQEFDKIFRIEGETEEEKNVSELNVIDTMMRIIYTFKPDIITAHNGENFDWNFLIERCNQLGTSIEAVSSKYFNGESIYKDKKESVLKLGGEVEHFFRTNVPGIIITDSLHAVRRAQATNSNFKEANLKYSTKFLGLVKPNRVYVPGDIIDKTLIDLEEHYAFNNDNGDWYIYDPNFTNSCNTTSNITKRMEDKFVLVTRNEIMDGYKLVSGKYIVERYLMDDLWECDKVEYALNSPEFNMCKILPIPFQKVCTMGTAGLWKGLMMAWSYENNLSIPAPENTGAFTGGLSRLLNVGYVDNVVKLDYNSLYPSIILTWGIEDNKDLMGSTLMFLEYVLTSREKHKKLKKNAGKIVDKYEEKLNNGESLTKEEKQEYDDAVKTYQVEDNTQAVWKKLGNSFFGALGSNNGSVYPWKAPDCAERTTCTGRQSLRLMISHFSEISEQNGLNDNDYNYKPIVGDSFTPDTPLFIKYDNGLIDIRPISELINESEIKVDELGREYDYSKKNYKVLCRSGWVEPSYIYRHKTDKNIYEVTEGDMKVEVTEDHSLFNSDKVKIKPSEINENTVLEYYNGEIKGDTELDTIIRIARQSAKNTASGCFDRVPYGVLNSSKKVMKAFYNTFMENYRDDIEYSKTCLAGLQYLKKMIS